ncbi:hypothetical protein BGW37DRAFT_502410 [Umbelopsis sp. PMI_123]|nr:hypothetical protein BGW37DRAFT_502410 [Umbelopsis sp. PMI_123]
MLNRLSVFKTLTLLLCACSVYQIALAIECTNPRTTTVQQVVLCDINVGTNELNSAGGFFSCSGVKTLDGYHYYCFKFDKLDPSWLQKLPIGCVARIPTCVGWFGDGSKVKLE